MNVVEEVLILEDFCFEWARLAARAVTGLGSSFSDWLRLEK